MYAIGAVLWWTLADLSHAIERKNEVLRVTAHADLDKLWLVLAFYGDDSPKGRIGYLRNSRDWSRLAESVGLPPSSVQADRTTRWGRWRHVVTRSAVGKTWKKLAMGAPVIEIVPISGESPANFAMCKDHLILWREAHPK